jgi:hypothetical protein
LKLPLGGLGVGCIGMGGWGIGLGVGCILIRGVAGGLGVGCAGCEGCPTICTMTGCCGALGRAARNGLLMGRHACWDWGCKYGLATG